MEKTCFQGVKTNDKLLSFFIIFFKILKDSEVFPKHGLQGSHQTHSCIRHHYKNNAHYTKIQV